MPRSAFAKAPAAAPAVTLGREECSVSWRVAHKAWGLDRRTHWRDNVCFVIQWFNKTTCGFWHKRWRQWSFFAIRRCGMCEATVLNTKTCSHRHSDPELQCLLVPAGLRLAAVILFPSCAASIFFYGALHIFLIHLGLGNSGCISHPRFPSCRRETQSSQDALFTLPDKAQNLKYGD